MLSADFQPYYDLLMKTIATYESAGVSAMETVEVCFKSSLEQWRVVHLQVRQRGFGSAAEEIHFFREVKPAFGAWIEYYTFRYHALLFAPVGEMQEVRRFWVWEQRKMEKFFEDNAGFFRYLHAGDCSRDGELFRRDDPGDEPDAELSSPGDRLVTIFRAYQLYERYIQVAINQTCPLEA